VAAMENTPPSPSGSPSTGGSPATGQQRGWQRTRPLVSGPGQSPLCWLRLRRLRHDRGFLRRGRWLR
jgi:hypothetical protein